MANRKSTKEQTINGNSTNIKVIEYRNGSFDKEHKLPEEDQVIRTEGLIATLPLDVK